MADPVTSWRWRCCLDGLAALVLGLGLALVLASMVMMGSGCGGGGGGGGGLDGGAVDGAADGEADGEADADAEADGGVDPRFAPLMAALEAERGVLGAPGVAVAVVEAGEVVFAAGLGSKHPELGGEVGAETLFRIGSVTKMLTALGVLQQVEDGAVTLDASVTTPLPGFGLDGDVTWAPSITVRDLLTHRSGLCDHITIEATAAYAGDDGLADYFLGPGAPIASAAYLIAPAGRFWNYTNPGYMLAGLVTERLSGVYYREYLAAEVLAPLGMNRTWFFAGDVLADGDYAYGDTVHWETGLPVVVGPESYANPWARPAGFAWSSVLDLAQMVLFLRDGDAAVLADDSLRLDMIGPQVNLETLLDRQHYGYGLFVDQGLFWGEDFYEVTLVRHGGAINGYSADLYWLPDQDVGIVLLANTDGAYFNESVVVALQTLVDLPAPSAGPDLTVDPADFGRYVGTYADPHNVGDMIVTLDGSDLRVSMPLLDSLSIPYDSLLVPVLPHNFELTVQGLGLPATFILDGQGEPEYLRTRYFVGARVLTPSPAPAPATVSPIPVSPIPVSPIPVSPIPVVDPELHRARLVRLLHRARKAPSPWRLLRR